MANTSILAAFERMWQHVVARLGDKANIDHDHEEYETKINVENKLNEAKAYTDTAILNIELGSGNEEAIETLQNTISNKQDKNMIVNITSTTVDGNTTYSADKTFNEIYEAYNNGTNVHMDMSGQKLELNTVRSTALWFNGYNSSMMLYYTATVKSDNTVIVTSKNITASSYAYGEVKADTKSDTDTVPAKIGDDGKLYVPEYPTLDGYATETYVDDATANMSVYYIDYTNPNYEEAFAAYQAGRQLAVTNYTGKEGYPVDASQVFYFVQHYVNEQLPNFTSLQFYGLDFITTSGLCEVTIALYASNNITGTIVPARNLVNTNLGATMRAPLILANDPTEDLEAATKSYVDSSIDSIPSDALIVTFTDNGDGNIVADKTVDEIINAHNEGKNVVGCYSTRRLSIMTIANGKPQFAGVSAVWSGSKCYGCIAMSMMLTDVNANTYTYHDEDIGASMYIDSLETTNKSLVYAINEINAKASATDAFVVTFTDKDTTAQTLTADKTMNEVIEAYNAGKNIIGFYSNTLFYASVRGVHVTTGAISFQFSTHLSSWSAGKHYGCVYRNIFMESNENIYYYQAVMAENSPSSLTTTNKTLASAINELNANKASIDHTHSWNDLKNKPFSKTVSENTILNGYSISAYEKHPITDDWYTSKESTDFPVIPLDGKVKVIFEGSEYICNVVFEDMYDESTNNYLCHFGNSSLTPSTHREEGVEYADTGEPFLINALCWDGGGEWVFYWNTESAAQTFTIVEIIEDIVHLPEEYIPKKYATKKYVDDKMSTFDGVILKSSTVGSAKKFKLTVDDNGALTVSETE